MRAFGFVQPRHSIQSVIFFYFHAVLLGLGEWAIFPLIPIGVERTQFEIDYEKRSRAPRVITRKGWVYAGAFGVNYFLWRRFPWSLAVFLIYAIPLLLLLEVIGYRIVAENRHRISRWFAMHARLIKQSYH
jgi:hypothetical protein